MKSKRIASAVLALILICSLCLTGCGATDDGVYTVGVCQLMKHDALDQATQGFQDALVAELGEGNVNFDLQNAAGDSNTCATIVNSFVSNDVDLIMANATPALQAAQAAFSLAANQKGISRLHPQHVADMVIIAAGDGKAVVLPGAGIYEKVKHRQNPPLWDRLGLL